MNTYRIYKTGRIPDLFADVAGFAMIAAQSAASCVRDGDSYIVEAVRDGATKPGAEPIVIMTRRVDHEDPMLRTDYRILFRDDLWDGIRVIRKSAG